MTSLVSAARIAAAAAAGGRATGRAGRSNRVARPVVHPRDADSYCTSDIFSAAAAAAAAAAAVARESTTDSAHRMHSPITQRRITL